MKKVIFISILGIITMSAVLVYGFTQGNFGADGSALLSNPWGIVSLVDLYTGFILFSGWIIYREKNPFIALIWVVLMMVLGFFTASVYALYAAVTSANDWKKFWMGSRLL